MRFISKQESLTIGQTRLIKKFLLLPLKIGEETRWLERVKIKQEVAVMDVGGSMEWGNFEKVWIDKEFIDA
ncbi:hypothetical protein CN981_08520 [Priestia megaterium]|nr:hypothetical protein CN981_08520 [Priestia megaterium]